MNHLSNEELFDYCKSSEISGEILSVKIHIESCEICKKNLLAVELINKALVSTELIKLKNSFTFDVLNELNFYSKKQKKSNFLSIVFVVSTSLLLLIIASVFYIFTNSRSVPGNYGKNNSFSFIYDYTEIIMNGVNYFIEFARKAGQENIIIISVFLLIMIIFELSQNKLILKKKE